MRYPSLASLLTHGRAALQKGPVAIIMAEDATALVSTLQHHQGAGFATIVLLAPQGIELPEALETGLHRVDYNVFAAGALVHAVNRVIEAAPGIWLFYAHNGEYLFHPFCESRSLTEMIAFHTEERRDAFLTYVVDLYAANLQRNPDAVALDEAHLDRSGYYALARKDHWGNPRDRQLDFFGGLRWRFEEHVPLDARKIDRICLFKTKAGLRLRDDFTLNDEEMNTYACQWHNNITTALASFRTAKALRRNPGSRYQITDFMWHNSIPFDWHSQQLMDLGLMESGQWF